MRLHAWAAITFLCLSFMSYGDEAEIDNPYLLPFEIESLKEAHTTKRRVGPGPWEAFFYDVHGFSLSNQGWGGELSILGGIKRRDLPNAWLLGVTAGMPTFSSNSRYFEGELVFSQTAFATIGYGRRFAPREESANQATLSLGVFGVPLFIYGRQVFNASDEDLNKIEYGLMFKPMSMMFWFRR